MMTLIVVMCALCALAVAAVVACNVDWYDVRDRRIARRMGRPNSRLSKKASSLRESLRDLRVRRSELVTLDCALFNHKDERAAVVSYCAELDKRIDDVIHELQKCGFVLVTELPEYNAKWQDDPAEAERFVRRYGLRERSRGDWYVDPCGPLGQCVNRKNN